MSTITKTELNNDVLEIYVAERIDSSNAEDFDNEINKLENEKSFKSICFNMKDTSYISSACLRVLLKYKKSYPDTNIIGVSEEVYEVLEITGFSDLFDVKKA